MTDSVPPPPSDHATTAYLWEPAPPSFAPLASPKVAPRVGPPRWLLAATLLAIAALAAIVAFDPLGHRRPAGEHAPAGAAETSAPAPIERAAPTRSDDAAFQGLARGVS